LPGLLQRGRGCGHVGIVADPGRAL
jgi:hypothetical protein